MPGSKKSKCCVLVVFIFAALVPAFAVADLLPTMYNAQMAEEDKESEIKVRYVHGAIENSEPRAPPAQAVLLFQVPPGGALDPNGALAAVEITEASSGMVLTSNGTTALWEPVAVPPAALSLLVNPEFVTTFTTEAATMAGLGLQLTTKTGRVQVAFNTGYSANSAGVANYGMRFGTGTPPAKGAADTGLPMGIVATTAVPANFVSVPTSVVYTVTGLTPGTTYWFDMALASVSGVEIFLGSFGVAMSALDV